MKTFNELKSIFMELYKIHGCIYEGNLRYGLSEFNSTEGDFTEIHHLDNYFIVSMKDGSNIKSIRLNESFLCKNLFDTEVSSDMVIRVYSDCVAFSLGDWKGTKYDAQFADFNYVVPLSNSDEFANHFQKCYELCSSVNASE